MKLEIGLKSTQEGVSLIEVLVGIAAVSILAVSIGSLTMKMASNVRVATASGTRDMLRLGMLTYPLTNTPFLISKDQGVNLAFKDCVEGVLVNCNSTIWQPLSLRNIDDTGWLSGPDTNLPGGPVAGGPARFNVFGGFCLPQTPSADCIFEVATEFQAVCPTGFPTCGGVNPAIGFNIRFTVRQSLAGLAVSRQNSTLRDRKGSYYVDRAFILFGSATGG